MVKKLPKIKKGSLPIELDIVELLIIYPNIDESIPTITGRSLPKSTPTY